MKFLLKSLKCNFEVASNYIKNNNNSLETIKKGKNNKNPEMQQLYNEIFNMINTF